MLADAASVEAGGKLRIVLRSVYIAQGIKGYPILLSINKLKLSLICILFIPLDCLLGLFLVYSGYQLEALYFLAFTTKR